MRRLVTGHISVYPAFDLCQNSPGYCKNFLEKAEGILFFGLHNHLLFSFASTVHIHNDSAECDGKTQFLFPDIMTLQDVLWNPIKTSFPKGVQCKNVAFHKKEKPTDCVDNTLGLVLPVCTCAAHASLLPLIQLVQSLGPEICQCWTNYFLMVTHRNLGYATTNLMQDIWSCRSPRPRSDGN